MQGHSGGLSPEACLSHVSVCLGEGPGGSVQGTLWPVGRGRAGTVLTSPWVTRVPLLGQLWAW